MSFLIEISLLEVYKMEKICSSVVVKKTDIVKCFSYLIENLKVTLRNIVYNQQGGKKGRRKVWMEEGIWHTIKVRIYEAYKVIRRV